MKAGFGKYTKCILALILTVQTLCLCCVFCACTSADAMESGSAGESMSLPTGASDPAENYSRWLDTHYSASVATRGEWLNALLTHIGAGNAAEAPGDYAPLFAAACEAGIIDFPDCQPYMALTRAYVAYTLMRALGYEPVTVIPVDDEDADDDLLTLVYFGYFVPDEENRVHPEAVVTRSEYDGLVGELRRCALLEGKTILSFGDSIMFGVGNKGEGITDMIAEKYGMTAVDYSVCRATLGVNQGVGHIPDQLRTAAERGESADLILLNGGTNDMLHVPCGSVTEESFIPFYDESTFAGGLETCYALIRQNWGDVPVLFIRAHNMDVCDDELERFYGDYALRVSEKWDVPVADIYQDTDFNAEDPEVRDQYTFFKEQISRTDSIHPTASGYAKFYLPTVSRMIEELMSERKPNIIL